jgi:DtxR family Mn-dependent transcriptional regulator
LSSLWCRDRLLPGAMFRMSLDGILPLRPLSELRLSDPGRRREHRGESPGKNFGSSGMEEQHDEVLERIWTQIEENLGEFVTADELGSDYGSEDLLEHLEKEGFIRRNGTEIRLTESGARQAERLIRNHRLAECLFMELFRMEDPDLENTACRFEHILNPAVTESVCTFLGHPPVCPHGRKIPPGACCRRGTKELKPLVNPLSDLEPGKTAKIVFMTPEAHSRLTRLRSLGIMPGVLIRLIQKRPSLILTVDETTVALEAEVAREIYVKPEEAVDG